MAKMLFICSCGARSKILVTDGSINEYIYRRECIQKRLFPFMREHGSKALFWPDLASSHHAKTTLELLKTSGVNFVEKGTNHQMFHSITQLSAIQIKQNLKETGKTAHKMTNFIRMWPSATI
jgi:hypothetical protein